MTRFVTLGTYSISILHYSLFYPDERRLVFRHPIRVHKGIECEYYMYEEDEDHLREDMRDRLQDTNFIYEFAGKHEEDWKKLMTKIAEFSEKMSDDELATYFAEYWELLRQSQPLGDCFLNLDEVYLDGTMHLVEAKLKELGRENELDNVMITLSSPWEEFDTLKQEISFHALAVKAKGYDVPETVEEFRSSASKELQETFDTHMQNWQWIPHWYDNEPFSEQFLVEQLRKVKGTDVAAKYEELKNSTADVKEKSEIILDEFKADEEMRELIKGLRTFTFFRTRLDLHTSQALFTARPIYYEIAKRFGLTFRELKNLSPTEILAFLRDAEARKKANELVHARWDLCVEIFEGDKQSLFVGKEASEWVEKIKANLVQEESVETQELKGMAASPGIVEGPARVITSVEEVKTVLEGEVLVVPSTSIDFLVAMKKAVAIVTEVGGLTSHAAIVSRELGIPCVVNTQVATKALKTGQKIRVDGSKGLVEVV